MSVEAKLLAIRVEMDRFEDDDRVEWRDAVHRDRVLAILEYDLRGDTPTGS